MDENKFYVYQWVNDDTGEIFYVGKGSGNRYKESRKSRRNQYFSRYIKKHPNCHSEIILYNLDEQTSYQEEKRIISEYLQKGYRLTNLDEGGRAGGRSPGEANGMYGKTHTPEAIQKIKEANYGKTRKLNSNAKICEIYDLNDQFIIKFDCIMDAIDYICEHTNKTFSTITTYIGRYELNQVDHIAHKYKIKIYRPMIHDNTVLRFADSKESVTTTESIVIEKSDYEEASRVDNK